MRIGLVSSSSGSRGGGELYLCGLAEGLVQLGHEVHSVLSSHKRMDELADRLTQFGRVHRLNYHNTYDRRLRSLGAILARREINRLTHELADLPIDLLHLNKQNLEDGLDLLLASERTGILTVATIHVTRTMRSLRSIGAGLRDLIAVRALRSAHAPLIATAQSSLNDLQSMDVDQQRLHLVLNGVASAPSVDRDSIRTAWGCGPKDVVLGCVARIEPQKNPLFLLPLIAQLPAHVRLVWIGDGSLRQAMQQTAEALGVANRVILPGWQTDARAVMAGFDLFVLPSVYEGFPFAVLEAMAARLPCLASAVDGVAEAIIDGQTGFTCPPNDSTAWLDRLRQCLDQPQALRSFGEAGFQRYGQHFSLEAMARGTVAVYETAAGAYAAAPKPRQNALVGAEFKV